MNRVTIINLAGHAFPVEDAAEQSIAAWLQRAGERLAGDPDRDELLADFERAIADKCTAQAPEPRDVVTADHARAILDTLGEVEPAEPASGEDTTTQRPAADPSSAEEPRSWRERRLYRLTGDGEGEGQIAGVCAGIAAYLNVDVTVVRVLVVLLTVVTSGAVAIAYIAMALLVPEANSPERRAAVFGYGETAQEILSRARANAGPALASLGSLIIRLWRLVFDVLHVVAITATWVLLAAWAIAVVWVLADGANLLQAFDHGTSHWLVALWLTCIAWILVSITLRIAVASGRPDVEGRRRSRTLAIARDSAWIVSIAVAALGVFAIPASTSHQLGGITDGHGRVRAFDETFCVDSTRTYGAPDPDCEPGDVRID
jgi:phage shock protein PspC (stress-responsive transcriptional regulator)